MRQVSLYYYVYYISFFTFFSEFQKIYERLNINIIERGESFYQSRMENVVKELENKGNIVVIMYINNNYLNNTFMFKC